MLMPQNVSPSGRREVMGGLAKGLEVLRTFSRTRPHMTLSEIAARAGLPAATARRCLNTLEELGYVAPQWAPVPAASPVLEIGAVYLESMDIPTITHTQLEGLAVAMGGSSALAVLSGTGVGVRGARLGAHAGTALGSTRGHAHARACHQRWARCCSPGSRRKKLEAYFAKASSNASRRTP